ncbi:MAG: hypothetical protein LBH35_04395 [Treponema sp.]|jgi:hypothetical protein|nr:hypothetical protein [Treponema sp.]
MGARKYPRYESGGQVCIAGVLDTKAILKNLSVRGLCVESSEFLDIVPHSKYIADVFPETESNIKPFTVDIESKWIWTRKDHSESGFIVTIPSGAPAEKPFNDYLNFLSERGGTVD